MPNFKVLNPIRISFRCKRIVFYLLHYEISQLSSHLGQGPPRGVALQSPVSGNSATSPSGTSSNCTPPQAQSPPNSYIDVGAAASDLQATPSTTPAMVQYDHYGVPYTTYIPVMPNSSQSITMQGHGDDPNHATPRSASVSTGGVSSTDCSSADSTLPHTPSGRIISRNFIHSW